MRRLLQVLLAISLCGNALSQDLSFVQYLGNEGVLVTQGETSVLFDPLYDNSYGQYQMVPQRMVDAIFDGDVPYESVDAIFVSHFHGDHFAAGEMLRLLQKRQDIQLYAPAQAVSEMRKVATADDEKIFERVTQFDLEYGDAPTFVRKGGLLIEAVHIPHSGWPTARTDVQNIAFRITLEDTSTVLHLGDSDARLVHFEQNVAYWEEKSVDLALPPYWFFITDDGREVLESHLDVRNAIGIHVPDSFRTDPSSIPDELLGDELFTEPGEGRRFRGSQ